eukprot:g4891.t1
MLLQVALSKFGVKKSTAKAKKLALFTLQGEPVDTPAAIARLCAMQELLLLTPAAAAATVAHNAAKPIIPLPRDVLLLIVAFVPLPAANPFELLSMSACSKAWHAAVIAKYGAYGDTPRGCARGSVPRAVWYWADSSAASAGKGAAATWVRYAAEASACIEDGFRRGASEATIEIQEPRQAAAGGAKKASKGGGAGKRRVCVVDYAAMAQRNASRRGRVRRLLRAPRTLETIAATALTPEATRVRAPKRWRQVLKL